MKKAMLFVVSFFFAVSAHAASLNLTYEGTGGTWGGNATQYINSNNSDSVSAIGKGFSVGSWYSDIGLTSTETTEAVIKFTAFGIPLSSSSAIDISFGEASNFTGSGFIPEIAGGGESPFSGLFNFTTTVMLTAGIDYLFLIDGIKNVAGYELTVSAVPIPAALWLFGPALLGFFGLRRRAQKTAVVA